MDAQQGWSALSNGAFNVVTFWTIPTSPTLTNHHILTSRNGHGLSQLSFIRNIKYRTNKPPTN
jgi:hypothetical protein